MTEENLSDKRLDMLSGYKYAEKDVKEAVKKLNFEDLVRSWYNSHHYGINEFDIRELIEKLDLNKNKIFGEKLTK